MMVSQTSLNSNKVYSYKELSEKIESLLPSIDIVKKGKILYYNIPVSYDSETTSFFQLIGNNKENEKAAIMYAFAFSFCGYVIIGRTWNEFVSILELFVNKLSLSIGKRLVIYVHNLSFDFSFFRKWLEWSNVFSIKERTPIYAVTSNGIEFRCSLLLSGFKLEKVAENLQHYKIKKLVGDLDYKLIRHSLTPLSDKEIQYIINDVQIVVAYISETIKSDGNIALIPMTNTGYVREFSRNMCFYPNGIKAKEETAKELSYKRFIHRLNLSVHEYYQLKNGFQGGFTHANPFYVNQIINDVVSYDFNSSYPAVMVSEKFPLTSSELINKMTLEEFNFNITNYCCLFDIELFNVRPKLLFENYISRYRCRDLRKAVCANGRIISAEHLITTITEQDYFIIRDFYEWDDIRIANFRRYKRGYLPTDFIKAVLNLYVNKTTLKGVKGKEEEYMKSKGMVNACFGMICTDIIREEIDYYDNKWRTERGEERQVKTEHEMLSEITKYNKNRNRFLFYPWGVWVTAYARKNLFTAIKEFEGDYIYSDTDSVKVINHENHLEYIEKYNFMQTMKLYKAIQHHGLDEKLIRPKTKNGEEKILGLWENESIKNGKYLRFKTLGAKRYMTETEKEGVNITVSGLKKSVCVPYILNASNNNPFDFFNINMDIPSEYTGKQTHTYIDHTMSGVVTDYNGVTAPYYELSGVHLMGSPYKMGDSILDYMDYVINLRRGLE